MSHIQINKIFTTKYKINLCKCTAVIFSHETFTFVYSDAMAIKTWWRETSYAGTLHTGEGKHRKEFPRKGVEHILWFIIHSSRSTMMKDMLFAVICQRNLDKLQYLDYNLLYTIYIYMPSHINIYIYILLIKDPLWLYLLTYLSLILLFYYLSSTISSLISMALYKNW